MFRKPKRKLQTRSREDHDDNNNEEPSSIETELVAEAKKRLHKIRLDNKGISAGPGASHVVTAHSGKPHRSTIHQYQESGVERVSNSDLATRVAEHHSPSKPNTEGTAERGADGIFRNHTRNKFLAGPIRASQNVRVTARFDYQPDICKDYKDTGFCGYGDSCIYLHDRGDTMTGWQLDQQWEEQQKQKKVQQEKELQEFVDQHSGRARGTTNVVVVVAEDGLPFACHICREAFKEPVVTACGHYFCEKCIMDHVRANADACPICGKDTSAVFNQPTKLIAKKRKLVGANASWEEFAKFFTGGKQKE